MACLLWKRAWIIDPHSLPFRLKVFLLTDLIDPSSSSSLLLMLMLLNFHWRFHWCADLLLCEQELFVIALLHPSDLVKGVFWRQVRSPILQFGLLHVIANDKSDDSS